MSKFLRETVKSAKSIEEAKELALAELGADEDDVVFETLDEGSKGFLGFGSKEAKVKAEIRDVPMYAANKFLKDVFKAMNLEVKIDTRKTDEGFDIELSGESMGIVIGKRGDTLDAVQYLASLIANHESDEYVKVSVDTEDYRKKRTEALIALSERIAEKVMKSGRKFTLEPMNPYERRVIHANLQGNENVTTYSIGSEPHRKVVIAPKNAKPVYVKKPYRKPSYKTDIPRRTSAPKKMYKSVDEMMSDNENTLTENSEE